MWKYLLTGLLTTALLTLTHVRIEAGITSQAVKGARRVAGKILGESAEAVGKKAVRTGVKHADDVGKVAARLSDDAARLVGRYGDDAAEAAAQISPQSTRKLLMLADDLHASGKAPEVMEAIAKTGRGEEIVNYLFKHKGTAIVSGAAITSLLLNPEETLGAVEGIAVGTLDAVGSHVVQPLISETAEHVLGPAVTGSVSALGTVLPFILGFVAVVLGIKVAIRMRQIRKLRAAILAAASSVSKDDRR